MVTRLVLVALCSVALIGCGENAAEGTGGSLGGGGGGIGGGDPVDCNSLQLECSGLNEEQCEQREDCSPYRTWRYGGGDVETCLAQPVEAKEFVLCQAGGCGFGFFDTAACIWRAADPQRCWCDGRLLGAAESNPDWGWAQACNPTDIVGGFENPCGWEPGTGGTGGDAGEGGTGGSAGAGGASGSDGSP